MWKSIVNNPAKTVVELANRHSLFEFNNCNFQGCGVGHRIDGAFRGYPFLFSNDDGAEYFFNGCYFESAIVGDRISGGRISIQSAKTLKVSNSTFNFKELGNNSNQLFLLEAKGPVETLFISDNLFQNNNPASNSTMLFTSAFACPNYMITNNLFLKTTSGSHINSANPPSTVINGLLGSNMFGQSSSWLTGALNPGIVSQNNRVV